MNKILAGVIVILLLCSITLNQVLLDDIRNNFGDYSFFRFQFKSKVPVSLEDALESSNDPSFDHASIQVFQSTPFYKHDKTEMIKVLGVNEQYFSFYRLNMINFDNDYNAHYLSKNDVFVNEDFALTFFGYTNIIGEQINIHGNEYTVSGVFSNKKPNITKELKVILEIDSYQNIARQQSYIIFDFLNTKKLLSNNTFHEQFFDKFNKTEWNSTNFYTTGVLVSRYGELLKLILLIISIWCLLTKYVCLVIGGQATLLNKIYNESNHNSNNLISDLLKLTMVLFLALLLAIFLVNIVNLNALVQSYSIVGVDLSFEGAVKLIERISNSLFSLVNNILMNHDQNSLSLALLDINFLIGVSLIILLYLILKKVDLRTRYYLLMTLIGWAASVGLNTLSLSYLVSICILIISVIFLSIGLGETLTFNSLLDEKDEQ